MIKPEDGSQTVEATVSSKILANFGIFKPDPHAVLNVCARLNRSNRWNVVSIKNEHAELGSIAARVIGIELRDGSLIASIESNAEAAGAPAQIEATAYRLILPLAGSREQEARVTQSQLNFIGIRTLPLGLTITSNWIRDERGWKLTKISDPTLTSLFTPNAELPVAKGFPLEDWQFADDAKSVRISFQTQIDGLVLLCPLFVNTLRQHGLRELGTAHAIEASLVIRDGQWRLAELLSPRPDKYISGDTLYAVKTRLISRENDRFGNIVNWLDIVDDVVGLQVTQLDQSKLVECGEENLAIGALIVCDLKRGKKGWHASRIHRVSD